MLYGNGTAEVFSSGIPGVWTGMTPPGAQIAVHYAFPDELTTMPTRYGILYPPGITTVTASYARPGRADLEYPPPGHTSQIMLDITLPSPAGIGQSFLVQTLGANGLVSLSPAANATSLTETISGPALWPLTPDDRIMISRAESSTPAARLTGSFITTPMAQTGGTTTLTGTMSDVVQDQSLTIDFDASSLVASLATDGWTSVASVWSASATPGASVGHRDGVFLAGGEFTTQVSGNYGNPTSWPVVVYARGGAIRSTSNGTATTSLSRAFSFVAPATSTSLELPGIPRTIAVAGMQWTADNTRLPLDPTTPIDIEIGADNVVAGAVYKLELRHFWLGPVYETTRIFELLSTEPTFTVPPGMFESGPPGTYFFRVTVIKGYASPTTGDFTPTLPVAACWFDSNTFTLQ